MILISFGKQMAARERRAKLKAEGKCVRSCGNQVEPGHTMCEECLDKMRTVKE